jgi:hypothetical protein
MSGPTLSWNVCMRDAERPAGFYNRAQVRSHYSWGIWYEVEPIHIEQQVSSKSIACHEVQCVVIQVGKFQ